MKIVVNWCYGGFSISEKAMDILGVKDKHDYDFNRTDQKLIEVVEKLGDEANGNSAELYVIEIPDEATDWRIQEYDGNEDVIYVVDGKMHFA